MKSAYQKVLDMIDAKQDFYINWINYPVSRLDKNPDELRELRRRLLDSGFVPDTAGVVEDAKADYLAGKFGLPQETWNYVG